MSNSAISVKIADALTMSASIRTSPPAPCVSTAIQFPSLTSGPHESIGASSMPAERSVSIGCDTPPTADIHQAERADGSMSLWGERIGHPGLAQKCTANA